MVRRSYRSVLVLFHWLYATVALPVLLLAQQNSMEIAAEPDYISLADMLAYLRAGCRNCPQMLVSLLIALESPKWLGLVGPSAPL